MYLSSLDIRRAMSCMTIGEDNETAEDRLDAFFEVHPEFEREWLVAPGNIIDLTDEAVIAAMDLIDVDINEVKREILCQI
jgi:hypothetical protein